MANIYMSPNYYALQQVSRGARVLIYPSLHGAGTDGVETAPGLPPVEYAEGDDMTDGEPRPADCVGFDDDNIPLFLCTYSGMVHRRLTFALIETAADYPSMQRGTWTWLPAAI